MTHGPVSVTIGEVNFACTVCRGAWFEQTSLHLTSNRQLFGWAKEDATALICTRCGYLHLFYNPGLRFHPAPPASEPQPG